MPVPGVSEVRQTRVLARDRAYEAIRAAILDGTLHPGERLDDGELEAWLGMSKTPIRQALHALTVEGFVETAAQSYTRVVEPRVDDAVLHMQTIGVFVLGVLDLTLDGLAAADRDALIADVDRLIAGLRAADLEGSIDASRLFYTRLMALCPNRVLLRLAERTLAARAFYVGVAYRALGIDWPEAAQSYAALRSALAAEDARAVAAAAREVFRIDAVRPVRPAHDSAREGGRA
ncbi:GntR family transcriptional regulator [Leifsonia shinshuensis]|uniref:DNA-binding GntR family transcriptional regulator n=1 Tax=Leifsonia shinshuensis TaxID=150026 RepID=A0A853CYS3_9MICO|nr:GntR family transcriptional regulator [Leifsonia shinshuensis]NYJ25708.1 DNA-binding GntR family transcriptional regulator [Leifsonia shinshuensis]